MEGAVVAATTGPVVGNKASSSGTSSAAEPLVKRLTTRWRKHWQAKCPVPTLLIDKTARPCDDLDRWIQRAREILRSEPWIKVDLRQEAVSLDHIAPALTHHKVWTHGEAKRFVGRTVGIRGLTSSYKRLALILWGIETGVLKPYQKKPGIIINKDETHDCDDIDEFADKSKSILKKEGWLAFFLKDPEVELSAVAEVLRTFDYCSEEDVASLGGVKVTIVGAEDAVHRLAVILWSARERILYRAERTSGTGRGDEGIDLQSEEPLFGWSDPLGPMPPGPMPHRKVTFTSAHRPHPRMGPRGMAPPGMVPPGMAPPGMGPSGMAHPRMSFRIVGGRPY